MASQSFGFSQFCPHFIVTLIVISLRLFIFFSPLANLSTKCAINMHRERTKMWTLLAQNKIGFSVIQWNKWNTGMVVNPPLFHIFFIQIFCLQTHENSTRYNSPFTHFIAREKNTVKCIKLMISCMPVRFVCMLNIRCLLSIGCTRFKPANKNRIQQIEMKKRTQQQPEHNWAKKLPTHQQQLQLENIV